MKSIIKYLYKRHMTHAVIALIGMYPMIAIHELLGGNALTAALTWSLMYYMREVTQFFRLGAWRALMPWLWNYHDRTQTIYVIVVSFASGVIYVN